MIKHHPSHELLSSFVSGDLPLSLTAAVAMHAELCQVCEKTIARLTAEQAQSTFSVSVKSNNKTVVKSATDTIDFEQMFSEITADESIDESVPYQDQQIEFNKVSYRLPRALHNMPLAKQLRIGKLTRSRLLIDEGSLHSHLLHIDKQGGVPQHNHKGFELTLLLDGSFSDEMGTYHKGDFIWLNNQHNHKPFSEEGCLCFTVADDALEFTQGLSKLLNPFGNLIY